MNVEHVKFRCSRLGDLMTEAKGNITEIQLKEIDELVIKSKAKPLTPTQGARLDELIAKRDRPPILGDTCTNYLTEVYLNLRYGRKKDVTTRAMTKGIQVEEDSITLYSRFKKMPFFKNEDRFSNDIITGTPDCVKGRVIDLKSSWDIFTFFQTTRQDLNKKYDWQLQGYLELMDPEVRKEPAALAYCLVDTPETMIQDAKRRLQWQMGLIDADINQDYVDACAEIDRLGHYTDIPMEERVNELEVPYDPAKIVALRARAKQARQWMAATWPDFFDITKDNKHANA